MKKRLIRSAARVLFAVALIIAAAGYLMAQPTFRRNRPSAVAVSPERLRAHVTALSKAFHPRDWTHEANLGRCADYLADHFAKAGAVVQAQPVTAHGRKYRNVIARFGVGRGSKLVVGAHYDACAETPGADDNASGALHSSSWPTCWGAIRRTGRWNWSRMCSRSLRSSARR